MLVKKVSTKAPEKVSVKTPPTKITHIEIS
jgi:hypothetical protein